MRLSITKRVYPKTPKLDVIICDAVLTHQYGHCAGKLYFLGVHIPRIAERFSLIWNWLAGQILVYEIIILFRIKRRIKIYQIDRMLAHLLHSSEIVAVI